MTSIARVYVNHIEVGALPAAQYHAFVQQVRRDWRLHICQGLNVVGAIVRFLLTALRLVPYLWFLLATALILWQPDSITEFITALPNFTPSQLSEGFRRILAWSIFFTACSSMFRITLIGQFSGFKEYGYVNVIDREVSHRIREVLEVPAEGYMRVEIVDDGAPSEQ